MDRRIYGIETEYGLLCAREGRRGLSADEVARLMFRGVVASARSSNVFLANGGRLYLDVGNHPEYATAECDTLPDLVAQQAAGDRIIQELLVDAGALMADEGLEGQLYAFKNNTDSAGNSFGCHENYLLSRGGDLDVLTQQLVPFLVTRQLICGAGKLHRAADGAAAYRLSQRAEVMWAGTSSATTRSRPLINTRDEPHADAARYRRLHIIVGDSNMSQTTTALKVGSTDLVLRTVEAGARFAHLSPANPATAIRDVSRDLSGQALVRTVGGPAVSAVAVQREYWQRAAEHLRDHGPARPLDTQVVELWDRALTAVETGDWAPVAADIDWVIKHRLLARHAQRHGLDWSDARMARLELAYHDIDPQRGLFGRLSRAGAVSTVVSPAQVDEAAGTPPATTRARLRGAFVAAAQRQQRDFTVDWSHLRLTDAAQRTVVCQDPFLAQDLRVDRLIASMAG